MGQAQTTPEYIDIFDTEPRRLSQKHKEEWERVNSVDNEAVTLRRDDFLRRGHRNEESEDYCYAYSGSVSREGEDEVDAPEPMKVCSSVTTFRALNTFKGDNSVKIVLPKFWKGVSFERKEFVPQILSF